MWAPGKSGYDWPFDKQAPTRSAPDPSHYRELELGVQYFLDSKFQKMPDQRTSGARVIVRSPREREPRAASVPANPEKKMASGDVFS